MTHVEVDLETLGTSPGAVILSIGAVYFDDEGLGKEFYEVVSTPSCIANGMSVDQSTVDWWSKQSAEARVVLDQADVAGLDIRTALVLFNEFLHPAPTKVKLWGNGSDFDNALLIAAYKLVGLTPAWKFYNNRCHRTLKNLGRSVSMPDRVGTYHNALDDAKTQALHAIALHKALGVSL